jgi:hypothetical protein
MCILELRVKENRYTGNNKDRELTMNADTFFDPAGIPDPIDGIYNHCDRWCKYCTQQARCLAYTAEHIAEETPVRSETALVHHLSDGMEIARHLLETLPAPDDAAGATDLPAVTEPEPHTEDPLFQIAGRYLNKTNTLLEWLPSCLIQDSEPDTQRDLESAIEIIRWYQYHIGAKLLRALHARRKSSGDEEFIPAEDPNKPAKIALIGIDRSIGAWGILSGLRPEFQEETVEAIFLLNLLRGETEKEFPGARSFLRHGFDDV